jgi:hypothetical protein
MAHSDLFAKFLERTDHRATGFEPTGQGSVAAERRGSTKTRCCQSARGMMERIKHEGERLVERSAARK